VSETDHPWRQTLATLALAVYFALALYLLLLSLVWLTGLASSEPWSFTPVVT
jgi:hypothetical protein